MDTQQLYNVYTNDAALGGNNYFNSASHSDLLRTPFYITVSPWNSYNNRIIAVVCYIDTGYILEPTLPGNDYRGVRPAFFLAPTAVCGTDATTSDKPHAFPHDYGKWELTQTETATEVSRTCQNNPAHQEKKTAEIQLVIPKPYTYNGKECKPKVSIKVSESNGTETTLKENTDYTLSYENNIKPGTATVKISGIGNYTGESALDFEIAQANNKGGSSITRYEVTFEAGKNGKITKGNTSIKVSRNAMLTDSQIPLITENEGYQFMGWSIDGKTTVGPTATMITKPTTFTALYEAITTAPKQHKAYLVGYEGKFNPNSNITRAETAAILARLTDGFDESERYKTSFLDVDDTAWYAKYIDFEENKNVITGYPDGTFHPKNHITRAEFTSIIARFANLDTESTDAPFTDVKGHWAEKQIKACYKAGYIKGYENNSFNPDHAITRAEAVVIINRALNRNDIKEYNNPFRDVTPNHWAYMDIMEAAITHTTNDLQE